MTKASKSVAHDAVVQSVVQSDPGDHLPATARRIWRKAVAAGFTVEEKAHPSGRFDVIVGRRDVAPGLANFSAVWRDGRIHGAQAGFAGWPARVVGIRELEKLIDEVDDEVASA